MVKFRDFDLFGSKLEFKLDGKEKYKTIFGALCSLIYISSIMIIGGLCIKDFFDTKNLNVTYTWKEKDVTENSNFSTLLNNDNFFFAFQIVDVNAKVVLNTETKQVIYPIPIYTQGILDLDTGLYSYTNRRLNIKNCTKKILGDQLKFNYLLNYLCIDLDEITLGGGWSNSFIDYLSLTFKTCDVSKIDENTDILFLENDNINCSSEKDVEALMTQSYLDIFVPSYKLDLNINNETALTRIYSNLYDFLDLVQFKNSDIYLQETTFKDDHGYFIDSPISTSYNTVLGTGKKFDSTGLDLPKRSKETYMYRINLNYSASEYAIERRQTRIQDLIANIMGIIGIIEVIIGNIADFYNSTMLNISVLNKVFNFSKEEEEEENRENNLS